MAAFWLFLPNLVANVLNTRYLQNSCIFEKESNRFCIEINNKYNMKGVILKRLLDSFHDCLSIFQRNLVFALGFDWITEY